MSALDNAQYMLDKSQGDVRSQEHKNDLLMQALISAVIAVAEALDELNKTMRSIDLIYQEQTDKIRS
jgi:hypothetical protein